jgi:hypothetical protein
MVELFFYSCRLQIIMNLFREIFLLYLAFCIEKKVKFKK